MRKIIVFIYYKDINQLDEVLLTLQSLNINNDYQSKKNSDYIMITQEDSLATEEMIKKSFSNIKNIIGVFKVFKEGKLDKEFVIDNKN